MEKVWETRRGNEETKMKNRTDRQKKAHGDVWFTFMANRAAADGMCSRRKLSCAKNLSWYMNEGQIYCCSGCSMCFIFPLWQFWRHAVKTGMMCFPSRPVLKEKTVFLAGTGVHDATFSQEFFLGCLWFSAVKILLLCLPDKQQWSVLLLYRPFKHSVHAGR